MDKRKIGELLVEAGAVAAEDVNLALGTQRSARAPARLGQVLVGMGKASQAQVARALAEQFHLPYVELTSIPESVSAMVPLEYQAEHRVIPFKVEVEGKLERLHVAVADPSNLDIIDELRFQLGKPVRVHVASQADIDAILEALRGDDVLTATDVADDSGEHPIVAAVPGPPVARSPPAPAAKPTAAVRPASAPPVKAPTPSVRLAPPPARPSAPVPAAAAPRPPPRAPMQIVPPHAPPAPPAAAARAAAAAPALEFEDEDLLILDELDRLAHGEQPNEESLVVRPAQLLASMIRLLMKKGVITEAEFLEELSSK